MPTFLASGVSTMPEYISKRYGGKRLGRSLAILSLMIYIFARISVCYL